MPVNKCRKSLGDTSPRLQAVPGQVTVSGSGQSLVLGGSSVLMSKRELRAAGWQVANVGLEVLVAAG